MSTPKRRTAVLEAEPLHLSGADEAHTLCGLASAGLPVCPSVHARRDMAGPRCTPCFDAAGLGERGTNTRRKADSGPWEQLRLWS